MPLIFNIVNIFYLSFGSCGGYIAGSRRLVNYIRINSHAHCYASSMSAPIAQQIISSLKILTNKNNLGLRSMAISKYQLEITKSQ